MNDTQCGDGARLRHGVRVGGDDELRVGPRNATVHVRAEAEGPIVGDRRDSRRHRPRHVRDHDELIDLRLERGQRQRELGRVAVGDDDRGDSHARTLR